MTTIEQHRSRLADRIRRLRLALPDLERDANELGSEDDEGILGAECSRALEAECRAKAELQATLFAYFDLSEAAR